MKKINLNSIFVFSFLFISAISFSQNDGVIAYAEKTTIYNDGLIKPSNATAITNLNDVLKEVQNYLSNNVKAPEILGFYNTDVKVLTSFKITETGDIKNISISRKSDKALGKAVVKELNKLSKITPVKEDGVAVEKYISVPVVFEVE